MPFTDTQIKALSSKLSAKHTRYWFYSLWFAGFGDDCRRFRCARLPILGFMYLVPGSPLLIVFCFLPVDPHLLLVEVGEDVGMVLALLNL